MKISWFSKISGYFIVISLLAGSSLVVEANNSKIKELEEKIEDRQEAIEKLDEEIVEQEKKVQQVATQKQSLQSEIQVLDSSKKKVETGIQKTENQIDYAELTIEKLNIEINNKTEQIANNKKILANAIREMNNEESNSFIEVLLNYESLSKAWDGVENLEQFQDALKAELSELQNLKLELLKDKSEREGTKVELEAYKQDLAGQKQVIVNTKKEKDELLSVTKSREATYLEILAEKRRQRQIFEQELLEFESQLQIFIDPNSFPKEGSQVLSWPLASSIKITQLFGTTAFAKKNPSIYGNRPFHPGVDFGASIGTKILAARQGTVWKTGNTDAIPGCYSWGKWILIRHDNGLSTLYAHLSAINVREGQNVSQGTIIGYSGNTGYSTGPHLHFTVYATQGVRIVPFEDIRSSTSCRGAVTPAADPDAYLDPESYLPNFQSSMMYL